MRYLIIVIELFKKYLEILEKLLLKRNRDLLIFIRNIFEIVYQKLNLLINEIDYLSLNKSI
jgi:hypothetical protein